MPIQVMLTLGDLRRKTAGLPDDTAILIETEHCTEWCEVSDIALKYLPPVAVMEVPGALILEAGQEVTEDHHIGPRFDVYLEHSDRNGGLRP